MTDSRLIVRLFLVFALGLSMISWLSPPPERITDRGLYEATAAQTIVPDCADLQCFRVLVPWVVGRFPGPSVLRWKAYAVICNAAAAVALIPLCLTFGLSRRVAVFAASMSAFGFGSLYTLHDPFTSDPLMYLLGPFETNQLLIGRLAFAAWIGVVGVLAKEFAAAPLYAFAAQQLLERRWGTALRAFIAGNWGFITWALLTMTLMLRFNYGWGRNGVGSANLVEGAALAMWLREQSLRGIVSAMFNEFGPLYVLVPAGLLLAPRALRQLALVSIPIAALFCVVQQPDRALWNFHYLIVPIGAIALAQIGDRLAWALVALFAIGNLRVGAQMPFVPPARFALGAACLIAFVAAAITVRQRIAVSGHFGLVQQP
jgi:hypothetical protein